jgi:hypothetical protein
LGQPFNPPIIPKTQTSTNPKLASLIRKCLGLIFDKQIFENSAINEFLKNIVENYL